MHKQGEPIHALLSQYVGHPKLERLPADAPMPDPVEPLWSWLKYGRLCNFALQETCELNLWIAVELRAVRRSQRRLQNLFRASPLPLPRASLT